MTRVDLLVRNGTVVTSVGRGPRDIAARGGRIVAVAERGGLDGLTAARVLDAGGRYVVPGIVDGHVHFRDPGSPWKEDFGSGSRAAVMGGVTTVLDMPNTDPPTDSVEHARAKVAAAERSAWCDVGLIGVVDDDVTRLRPMTDAGLVVGFKAFLGTTTGDIGAPSDGVLLDAMREVAGLGMRLGFHAENGSIMEREVARLRAAGRTDPLAHVESRPVVAEVEAIGRACLFARVTGCPIHVFHVSSREGLETVEHWRALGVDCTSEATPHHCLLGAEDMALLGARMRINPPVRARAEGHGEALLRGLATGAVTVIATDHAPHTREEKLRDDIWQVPSGFAGVETSLRLFLTHGVHAGRMTLEQLVRASSEGPARTWGLYPRKGAIAVGSDADLTVIDLDREDVIEEARLHGRSNLTPFEGRPTKGAAVATIVRGRVVMEDGELVGEPSGRLVARVTPTD